MLRNIKLKLFFIQDVSKYLATGAAHPRLHSFRNCCNIEKTIRGGYGTNLKQNVSSEEAGESGEDYENRLNYVEEKIFESIQAKCERINWGEEIRTATVANVRNLSFDNACGTILSTLKKKQMFDEARSFMNYLFAEKKCSPATFYMFLTYTLENPNMVTGFEEIILKALKQMNTSKNLKLYLPFVLPNPKLWKNVVEFYMSNCDGPGDHALIIKYALKNDNVYVFNHFLKLHNVPEKNAAIINFILDFICQKLSENNKVDVVSYFKKFSHLLTSTDSFLDIEQIVQKCSNIIEMLNEKGIVDKNYKWIASINETSKYCPECLQRIQTFDVNDEEIAELKTQLENYVKDEKFLNSISYPDEWTEFEKFLKKVDYNIVVDYLNFKFFFLKNERQPLNILKNLKNMNLKPLVLGRKHLQNTQCMMTIRKNYPVFLVDNMSKDDVFTLYAALSKGKDCLIASNDHMSFMKSGIVSEEVERACQYWLRFHRCGLSPRGIIFPNRMMYGLQESISRDKNEFMYHIVAQGKKASRVACISRLNMKRVKYIQEKKEMKSLH